VKLTKDEKQKRAINEFFAGPVVKLTIEMSKEEYERLKRDERNYAEATVRVGDNETGKIYKGVALKLKGSAGSFQGIDGKPGMTLNFDKFKGAERFHGMKKFHLNNCAQDGTYLHEQIAGEMARRAGVPASRCTHVFVELNGRDLGLYVFKEAFTKDFLAAFYSDVTGDLYDGGHCKEIEEKMEKDLGDPKDNRAVKELISACQESDAAKRWERLAGILDVERFAAYCALEAILCHWDGYNFNRNNYRIYHEPETGKLSFFLHGMDQTLNDANFPLLRDFGTTVGNAFMRCPQGKQLYRQKLDSIYTELLKPTDWTALILAEGSRVKEALATVKDARAAKEYQNQIHAVRDQVNARIVAVGKQLGDWPKPLAFGPDGAAKIVKGWRTEGAGAQIDEQQDEGKPCLHIKAGGESTASWRTNLALEPGRYRFEARVRTKGVLASRGISGEGAGLRISGGTRAGQNAAAGDTPWKPVAFEFDAPGGDVVLVAELRASKGEAWFDKESLQIVRVK